MEFEVGESNGNQKNTLVYTEFASKMGSYSALKKREALISIVLIYRVVVKNQVKD